MHFNIPSLHESLRLAYESGSITAHEVAIRLYRAGFTFYILPDNEALTNIGIAE